MKTSVAPARSSESKAFYRPVSLALFYLGLALALFAWSDVTIWRFPSTLVVAAGLALVGWRRLPLNPAFSRYYTWAGALSICFMVSAIAAWTGRSLYVGLLFACWFAFITPGLSSLLREHRHLSALVGGLTIGMAIFSAVSLIRVFQGRPIFDDIPTAPEAYLLGSNRNYSAALALVVLPFLLSGTVPRPLRRFRWALIALAISWPLLSGSRLGLVGLLIVTLVYVLIQPAGLRKARTICGAILIGLIVVLFVQEIGGQALVSTSRLRGVTSGEYSTTDEIRELLLRKGWNLAIQHPLMGIGPGAFSGAYHPVVDEATTDYIRRRAVYDREHDGYMSLAAEVGFPALLFFTLLLGSLLHTGLRHRDSSTSRAATCSLVALLMMLLSGPPGPLALTAMALLLGAANSSEGRTPLERQAAAIGTKRHRSSWQGTS